MIVGRSGEPFDLDAFLARPLMAHLATASTDGSRESPVWFLWEDGAVWLIGSSEDSFPRRIGEDPRCALGFVDFHLERGLLLHVGMRGTATVERLDEARLGRLLRRYLGEEKEWNPTFVQSVIDKLDLMVRFAPKSVVMRDQSYFRSTRSAGLSRRPPRPTTHPWAVLQSLGVLCHLIHEGYRALRDCPHTEEATNRERTVTYFILHGVVEALGQIQEAFDLLEEIEPYLADIEAPFKEDLDKWKSFRDDSAHVIDRTHRVSVFYQNDAVIREDEHGYDADTVVYDWDADIVRTGISHTLLLGPAVDTSRRLYLSARQCIMAAFQNGHIAPPPGHR